MMDKVKPKGRNDGHKFDYSKVTDKIIVGSDLCLGRNCKSHEKEFGKLNVSVEINVAAERVETPPKDVISYTHLPVVDGYAPTKEQFDVGTSIINEAVKDGRTVYVHCKNGHGRSPTLVAAYLMRFNNFDAGEAIDKIMKRRPEIHIETSQKKALMDYNEG